jgi:alpha-tubulin suppressor-like RCC1 family protein/O-glycosyl hydrolase
MRFSKRAFNEAFAISRFSKAVTKRFHGRTGGCFLFPIMAFFLFVSSVSVRADYTATVNPNSILVTNFQGWGSSLCWWANVIGSYPNRTNYVDLAFTQLKLNIVRYNIGGGENPAITGSLSYRAAMPGFEPTNGVWNWNADLNQRWVLQAALARGANLVEAFANSPPWWMTVSGSVTGAVGGTNNLQTAYEVPFAAYLATVVSNLTVLDGVHFNYVTPMNEPSGGWSYLGQSQEGCHMSRDQQQRVIANLRASLNINAPSAGVDAPQDVDEYQSYSDLATYSQTTFNDMGLFSTHTYGANDAANLKSLAATQKKPLWMAEYGDNDATGMKMARRIYNDLTALGARAWIYWQVVDSAPGWGFLYNTLLATTNSSYTPNYTINEKFYVMGQFSEYVRPGYKIISVNDTNTLAAYNPTNSTLVLVMVNTSGSSFNITYNLSNFGSMPWRVSVSQTASGENMAVLPSPIVTNQQFTAAIPASSVTTFVLTTNINLIASMTLPATLITSGAATLNGSAAANGLNTAAWFEWGTNTSYGQRTASTNIGQSYLPTPISAALNGLAAGTIYHFRLDATNALGATFGADCRFTTGGRVRAWGDNSYGQTSVPMGLTNVIVIACGWYHGLALRNDGTVVAWGKNSSGQTNVPAGLSNVVAVAAGLNHSLALTANGTLVAWGANFVGQTNVPAGLTNATAIAAGGNGSLALKTDGTIVAWGWNNYGQTNIPAGLNNVVSVAAALYHNLVLKNNGTVVAWGDDTYGQTDVPVGLTNAVAIAAGEFHNLALKADGTVVAWGWNNLGQANVPAGLVNVSAIACGENYSLALQSNGTILAWGDNGYGQTNLPAGFVNVAQLSGGSSFGLAIANQLPQANGRVVSGYVNHDLTIGLSGNSPDGNPINFRITTLPSAGELYQSSNGARGNLIDAPNTSVSDNAGQVIFAPGANQTGSPYSSFNLVANDGLYDSVPGTVAVDIGLPPAPQLTDSFLNYTNSTFELNFTGASNATYSLWTSTNLVNWSRLGAANEISAGLYQLFDTTATNSSQRFYRASAP